MIDDLMTLFAIEPDHDLKIIRPEQSLVEVSRRVLEGLSSILKRREGATVGAGCTIGNDLTIGRFAMVGMGSLVTRGVPDFHLVVGSPARSVGCVCRCGRPLVRFKDGTPTDGPAGCASCGLRYLITSGVVAEHGAGC